MTATLLQHAIDAALDHIPRGSAGSAQNVLRMLFQVRLSRRANRRRSLAEVLRETVRDVQEEYPGEPLAWDEGHFGVRPEEFA